MVGTTVTIGATFSLFDGLFSSNISQQDYIVNVDILMILNGQVQLQTFHGSSFVLLALTTHVWIDSSTPVNAEHHNRHQQSKRGTREQKITKKKKEKRKKV
jgi:hypothetical protein